MFAALEGQCWWTRDGTRHVVDTPHAVAAYTRAILAAVADDEATEVWWSESRGYGVTMKFSTLGWGGVAPWRIWYFTPGMAAVAISEVGEESARRRFADLVARAQMEEE